MVSYPKFKKLLIVSMIIFITMLSTHAYFLTSIRSKTEKEAASDEIVEKVHLLLLNISGYKSYQGTLHDQWKIQVAEINKILNGNSHLKSEVKPDLNVFISAIEPEILNDNSQVAHDGLLLKNQEYIENLLSELRLFSQQNSSEIISLNRTCSLVLSFLFLIGVTLLLFSFYSINSSFESIRNLLRKSLRKLKINKGVNSLSMETEDIIEDELSLLFIKLIKQLQVKFDQKDKELRDKTELLHQVVNIFPLGVAISTLDGKELKLKNQKFSELYNLAPYQFDKNNFPFITLDKKKDTFKGVLSDKNLNLTKFPPNNNKPGVVCQKESTNNVDIQRIPLPNQNLLISIFKNHTRVDEERCLKESPEFSKVIFETDSIGFALIDFDGCFQKVNGRFCKIYGYLEEELIGHHFSILIPTIAKKYYTHAYRKKFEFNNGEESKQQEIKVVRKNGEIRNVLSNSEPYVSKKFEGFVYSVIDITEATTEKNKMVAAIEGGGLGTWNINFETGYNEINDEWAKMLGYKRSEIPNSKDFFESLIHPDDLPSFLRSVEAIFQGKQMSFCQELRLKCFNGKYKWILDSGKVIRWDSKGQPLIMAGSHIDVDKVKKKELELISTGERLRRAQEMGMVGDWELEVATENFSCSAMVFRIFGRKKSTSALELKSLIEQFHHTSAIKFQGAIKKLINDKSSIHMDGEVFLPDGKLKHLRIIAVPILDQNREVSRVTGIFQDVTSIHIAQTKLETTSKRLQLLSDNIPGGLIQFRVNGNLPPQVLYLSKGGEKIWNITRGEAFLGNEKQLFKNIHPNDHNLIRRSLQIATKRLKRLSIVWRTLSDNGQITWHHGIGIPTKNQDGTVTWNALVLDVTEKKIAEHKLREQEEFVQVLTKHASDAIIACDLSGKIKFVNQTIKEWAGPETKNAEPKDWAKAYHLYSVDDDHHLKPSELTLFRSLETGKSYRQEFLIKRPGEPVRYVQSNASALKDASGNRIGAMVVLRDITQKVQHDIEISNATLNAREKERTKIASEIHDGITQSLSVVAMNVKNLRYDYMDLAKSESYNKALNYLNIVIDQSRSLAHKIMPSAIRDFGIIAAVKELVEQSSFGSKYRINFEHNEYRRMNSNKELHIFRIIQEGLGNAMKHSEGTKIQINLFFDDDCVSCTIQDDGKGFDVKKSYHKQGIGLISMRDRVKKMKGKFKIFSNMGTVISFKIPVKYKAEENEKTSTNFYSR